MNLSTITKKRVYAKSFVEHMKEVHDMVKSQLEKTNAMYKLRVYWKSDCKHSKKET